MTDLLQIPAPGAQVLKFAGECLDVALETPPEAKGRAFLRTNLQRAALRRKEIIAATEADEPPLAQDWHDIAMEPDASKPGRYVVRAPLTEVGYFSCKACFIPEGETTPVWPQGSDTRVKVEPAHTVCANTVYTAFVRQFGKALTEDPHSPHNRELADALASQGYTVIPPSGTFRDLIKKLDVILGEMRFRILQLLPIHPTPTTFARMGNFGSPFAARDLMDVDPALAEFDTQATPMDQFHELVDAVHAHGARIFLDIPADHTGWASVWQEHHPEWFKHDKNGAFKSPGAWGVVWEDLVELDYVQRGLYSHIAEVFLFWCRQGVDGFRCDAGYMIPQNVWTYVTARVREVFPDTVFLLEGLGGSMETTERLLSEANLDWAYSEIFQTENRADFEAYLPAANALSERAGPLIHFAETHDNARLAQRGHSYARLRTMLAALFSHHGAFGLANGAEWFATERINVHNARPLNWGAQENQVQLIRHLNTLLATHPAFAQNVALRFVHNGPGNVLALLREGENPLLVLANLGDHAQTITWDATAFPPSQNCVDLLTLRPAPLVSAAMDVLPGQVICLSRQPADVDALKTALDTPNTEPAAALRLRKNLLELKGHGFLIRPNQIEGQIKNPCPFAFWDFPADTRREVMVAPNQLLLVRAPKPFHVRILRNDDPVAAEHSIPLDNGTHATILTINNDTTDHLSLTLELYCFGVGKTRSPLLALTKPKHIRVKTTFTGAEVRANPNLCAILANQRGASAYVPAAYGELQSKYNALLAINPDPAVPSDRINFFTRCRLWLQREGYSTAIDKTCLKSFFSDPSGTAAEWRFNVPCGMGETLPLTLFLHLDREENHISFIVQIERHPANETFRVIFRPDIEWRSFHHTTQTNDDFLRAVTPHEDGFAFAPDPARPHHIFIHANNGAFHPEPEWCRDIFLPVETQRGLDAHTDLFSPGWFHADLKPGDGARLTAYETTARYAPLEPLKKPLLTLDDALRRAMPLYMANRDDSKTIIAGFPWFLDWGRDTFIVLRGLIAAGETETALDILREFARFEDRGTLPNIIHGNTVGNRDTSDAPLWFVIAVRDSASHALRDVCASILTNYCDGTPNGIKMDDATGLIFSPAHFTWMDTNHPAATPRSGYPVEIQALWIAALDFITQHDTTRDWAGLAKRARASFTRLFTLPNGSLADCLRADSPKTSANDAVVEDAIRPNQLFAITLGVLTAPEQTLPILDATRQLLVPGALRSLADAPVNTPLPIWRDGRLLNDPHKPFWPRYEGDEDTSRKPAYHNGTAWVWLFPSYVEALLLVHGPAAKPLAAALLGSATKLFNDGCVGQLPEILDGAAPHTQRGCPAQAWSISEFLRVQQLTTQTP